MPQHQAAVQLRPAGNGGRGARRGAAVRAQDCRHARPSKQNAEAFERAVEEIFGSSRRLLDGLVTTAPPRDRARVEALKRMRFAKAAAR